MGPGGAQGAGSVAERLRTAAPASLPTAVTVSLDEPAAMRMAAAVVADAPLLKVKLDDEPRGLPAGRGQGAPGARLIVDPNEGWTLAILLAMADPISRLNGGHGGAAAAVGGRRGPRRSRLSCALCADEAPILRRTLSASPTATRWSM